MSVPARSPTHRLKGKQVPLTLYLPPKKYWLLKALSHQDGEPMHRLLRRAPDEVLAQTHRESLRMR